MLNLDVLCEFFFFFLHFKIQERQFRLQQAFSPPFSFLTLLNGIVWLWKFDNNTKLCESRLWRHRLLPHFFKRNDGKDEESKKRKKRSEIRKKVIETAIIAILNFRKNSRIPCLLAGKARIPRFAWGKLLPESPGPPGEVSPAIIEVSSAKELTDTPLTDHVRFVGGFDFPAVQFAWRDSPILYLGLTPSMIGPWNGTSGKRKRISLSICSSKFSKAAILGNFDGFQYDTTYVQSFFKQNKRFLELVLRLWFSRISRGILQIPKPLLFLRQK